MISAEAPAAVAQRARAASRAMAATDRERKDAALDAIADLIPERAADIAAANAVDVAAATEAGERFALVDRLTLTPQRMADLSTAVSAVRALPDPVGETIRESRLDNGLELTKVRVPLGVVAIIYEARPNVTVDAAALCVKSGNACILRGSRMAANTNAALLTVVREGLAAAGLPADAVQSLDPDRETLAELVADPHAADVVIPRGGEQLKAFLLERSRIPVLAAAGGNCHVYIDAAADPAKAIPIAVNAKADRPSACNAAETVLVHRDRTDLVPELCQALEDAGVEVLDDESAWATEFLDLKVGLRVVDSLDEALEHIAAYGTAHSEAIVTEDPAAAERFVREVDAAAVYVNASTRFTDGGEYGMGAEIGISTNRLHARGPVGLEELTTTKYVVRGNGQIR